MLGCTPCMRAAWQKRVEALHKCESATGWRATFLCRLTGESGVSWPLVVLILTYWSVSLLGAELSFSPTRTALPTSACWRRAEETTVDRLAVVVLSAPRASKVEGDWSAGPRGKALIRTSDPLILPRSRSSTACACCKMPWIHAQAARAAAGWTWTARGRRLRHR
jgi:hypothetical protein